MSSPQLPEEDGIRFPNKARDKLYVESGFAFVHHLRKPHMRSFLFPAYDIDSAACGLISIRMISSQDKVIDPSLFCISVYSTLRYIT